jgi:hypothetical protein
MADTQAREATTPWTDRVAFRAMDDPLSDRIRETAVMRAAVAEAAARMQAQAALPTSLAWLVRYPRFART